jgi:hypothetical protein
VGSRFILMKLGGGLRRLSYEVIIEFASAIPL